jgi:hypothetical protein
MTNLIHSPFLYSLQHTDYKPGQAPQDRSINNASALKPSLLQLLQRDVYHLPNSALKFGASPGSSRESSRSSKTAATAADEKTLSGLSKDRIEEILTYLSKQIINVKWIDLDNALSDILTNRGREREPILENIKKLKSKHTTLKSEYKKLESDYKGLEASYKKIKKSFEPIIERRKALETVPVAAEVFGTVVRNHPIALEQEDLSGKFDDLSSKRLSCRLDMQKCKSKQEEKKWELEQAKEELEVEEQKLENIESIIAIGKKYEVFLNTIISRDEHTKRHARRPNWAESNLALPSDVLKKITREVNSTSEKR